MKSSYIVVIIALFSLPAVLPQSGYDVELVLEEPIYSWTDIPYGSGLGYFPFESVDFLDSYFIVGGNCNWARDIGTFEADGMYVFTDQGDFVGKRSVCFDTSVRAWACFEGGGCTAGTKILRVDDNTFIRELDPRSPVSYEITPSGIKMKDRLFFNNGAITSDTPEGTIVKFTNVAYANGKMIGVEKVFEGEKLVTEPGYTMTGKIIGRYSEKNAIYEIPGLRKVSEFSLPPKPCTFGGANSVCSGAPFLSLSKIEPTIGIGNYFIAREKSTGKTNVYRMPDTLSMGQEPEFIQTLSHGVGAYSTDPLDDNRIAMVSQLYPASSTLAFYKAGENGLEKTGEKNVPRVGTKDNFRRQFAIAGNYLAYSGCEKGRHSKGGKMLRFGDCYIKVEKNGELLSVESLPNDSEGFEQRAIALAISPDGMLMASAESSWEDNGHIYLYRISDFAADGLQAQCGNALLETSEQCDDGNNANGDGCSATCRIESQAQCGNGIVEAGEECDLGSGNGACPADCSASCTTNSCTPPVTPPTGDTQTIQFRAGWNLFSSSVFETVPTGFGSFQTTCTYTSPLWRFNANTQNYEQSDHVTDRKEAFWIRTAGDCTATVEGDRTYGMSDFEDYNLKGGWNFIGGLPVGTTFESIKGTCDFERGPFWYNPATNNWEQPTTAEPGKGYAVRVAANCNLASGGGPPGIPPIP